MAEITGNGSGPLLKNESVDTGKHKFLAAALVQVELLKSEHPARADPRFLSVRQVAKQLGVCPHTVYTLCETGKLKYLRVLNAIRIAREDLDAFLRLVAVTGRAPTPSRAPWIGPSPGTRR